MLKKMSRLIVCAGCATLTSSAHAQWSTEPGSPLTVGLAEGPLLHNRLASTSAQDGVVWASWLDNFCFGSLRLQRIGLDGSLLSPSGLNVRPISTCGFLSPPALVAPGESAVIANHLAALDSEPVQRIGENGQTEWPDGFSTTEFHELGWVTELANADVLVISRQGATVRADRLDASGQSVWASPSIFPTEAGSSIRFVGAAPHPDGGAFIFWDYDVPYSRLIKGQRILEDGSVAWENAAILGQLPPTRSASRFSIPSVVPDGQGGAMLVFVEGLVEEFDPARLFMQRIDANAELTFPIQGHDVSLGANRHFDPIALRDTNGEFVVVWLDGTESPALRAQRLTPTGDRLWSDVGVEVGPIELDGEFDAVLEAGRLVVASNGPEGVLVYTLDAQGQHVTQPVLAIDGATESLGLAQSGQGVVVTTMVDLEGSGDLVVAQRVNRGGRLGDPGCNAADIAEPIGVLDFSDVALFLGAFASSSTLGDLDPPIGVFDFSDVVAFLSAFGSGCP